VLKSNAPAMSPSVAVVAASISFVDNELASVG
jgi:hypothetical protein